ncbi:MAG: right-handed parallel beta-helix repeat-containing protein [Sphingomonas sp.]|jgi:hypothetical protein|uniref:hypothetical protein n=1 Tax=Sphingomonas sp. TaxID=28214 RepID=UPI003567719B
MKSTWNRLALLLVTLCATSLFYAAPVSAQATRTWISGVGDDVNPCSRTAPCKTFQGAIAKTAAGGEINCLDPGGFGSLTITKSISLICDSTESGVLVAATNGFIINSTNAVVHISGFDFEGLGQTGSAGVNGLYILNAAAVHIRNTKIRGFRNGYGVNFSPSNASGQLFLDNVTISESGVASNANTGGILINPAAGFSAKVTITNSLVSDNINFGLKLDTTGIVGSSINATVSNTVFSNDSTGILVTSPVNTGTSQLFLRDSVVTHNTYYGVIASGPGSTVRVANTSITDNATGIAMFNTAMKSYGDNYLDGNTTDGSFTAPNLVKK